MICPTSSRLTIDAEWESQELYVNNPQYLDASKVQERCHNHIGRRHIGPRRRAATIIFPSSSASCAARSTTAYAHPLLDAKRPNVYKARQSEQQEDMRQRRPSKRLGLVLETCIVISCLLSCATAERQSIDGCCQCGIAHEHRDGT